MHTKKKDLLNSLWFENFKSGPTYKCNNNEDAFWDEMI